jgi:hypothetical protein
MFYEVKVLDQQGKVKKVISSKRLSKKYWKRNNEGKEFTGNMGIEDDEFDYESGWSTLGNSRNNQVKLDESA